MERIYEIQKTYECPTVRIHKGVMKTENDWMKDFPNLNQGDCDIKTDWFVCVGIKKNTGERQLIIPDIINMFCLHGKKRTDDCQLRTPQYGCIGCRSFVKQNCL